LINLSFNWKKNRFTLKGVNQLAKLPKLETLNIQILPHNFAQYVDYWIVPASRQSFEYAESSNPQKKPLIWNFDVDSLAKTFPDTTIHLDEDWGTLEK
jgi:hypothetical protein